MKFIYFVFALNLRTHSSIANINIENDFESEYFLPTIQLVLLIHPFNKASVLPFSLGSIETQNYPKDRIKVFIRTELYKNDGLTQDNSNKELIEEKIKLNGLTIDMLKKWIRLNRHQYNDIEFVLGDRSVDENHKELYYWTTSRFKHLIDLKSDSLEYSRKNWAQFVLFIDSDVVLTNNKTFLSLTQNEKVIAIAPMLYSLGTYSNFWAGITDKGYYKRTDDYLPILERQRIGEFAVPMIHSCIFINLKHKKSINLTFDSRKMAEELTPFDDIIAFAKSAQKSNVQLFVNNNEVWGYIPPPIDANMNMTSIEQDIIDIELESLIEGPEFPIASSLISYVNRPKADKLNVDNIYVINLLRRPERRKRMLKSLEVMGIEAQVWRGTDGKELNKKIIESKGIKVAEGYVDPYHKRPMTFGEIGCFLSHFTIWQDIIRRNLSKVIILEDDVRFERNFKNKWNAALNALNVEEYDFVYLGRKIQGEPNESRISQMFVIPNYSYWTIGYFITRKGAQKLLDVNPLEKIIPVDEFLPIMYDKHTDNQLKQHFPIRNLKALSLSPLLIYPTHYVGDSLYISDTEDSNKMTDEAKKTLHPKHSEL